MKKPILLALCLLCSTPAVAFPLFWDGTVYEANKRPERSLVKVQHYIRQVLNKLFYSAEVKVEKTTAENSTPNKGKTPTPVSINEHLASMADATAFAYSYKRPALPKYEALQNLPTEGIAPLYAMEEQLLSTNQLKMKAWHDFQKLQVCKMKALYLMGVRTPYSPKSLTMDLTGEAN